MSELVQDPEGKGEGAGGKGRRTRGCDITQPKEDFRFTSPTLSPHLENNVYQQQAEHMPGVSRKEHADVRPRLMALGFGSTPPDF